LVPKSKETLELDRNATLDNEVEQTELVARL
jgi:hypothetical protein